MGAKGKAKSVDVFIAEWWVDDIVKVDRMSKRMIVLKMVLGYSLFNIMRYMLGKVKKRIALDLCSSWSEIT